MGTRITAQHGTDLLARHPSQTSALRPRRAVHTYRQRSAVSTTQMIVPLSVLTPPAARVEVPAASDPGLRNSRSGTAFRKPVLRIACVRCGENATV